jgi:serine phosphatase RsbU (regulator of sigma subunit)
LETVGSDGSPFGLERTRQIFCEHQQRPASEIVEALYRAACDFAGTDRLSDDVTLAVLSVGPPPAANS